MEPITFKLNGTFKTAYCKEPGVTISISAYQAKPSQPAIQLYTDIEPLLTATTCLIEYEQMGVDNAPLAPNETWIKDYSENEGVLDELIRHGVVERVLGADCQAPSGFVIFPRVKLAGKALELWEQAHAKAN